MNTANVWPPGKREPGDYHDAGSHRKTHKIQAGSAYSTTRRQCGRQADTYRWGFGRGFRDALRLAARRLPPEYWPVLDELASDYTLAGSDG